MDSNKKAGSQHEEFELREHPWDAETMGSREDVESLVRDGVYSRIGRHKSRVILFRRISAAAIILLIFSAGLYFLQPASNQQKLTTQKGHGHINDVLPAGDRATLTLANGSTIDLDAVEKGEVNKGSVELRKTAEGQVSFLATEGHSGVNETLNTLTTPKGGKYSIILPDGTKVWLNAASSLRFPAAFKGSDRKVYLTGEGYFEVAKNKEKPFKVYIKDLEVKVLGTHFNVMGHADEEAIKTTLLEGSVYISNGRSNSLLKPGQEGNLSNNGSIEVKEANISQAMAWKQDQFIFDKVDIQSIMRELSRWYDVDVKYQGQIPKNQFVGKISRKATLSQVLRVLELSHVHLKIEGKTIVVLP